MTYIVQWFVSLNNLRSGNDMKTMQRQHSPRRLQTARIDKPQRGVTSVTV